MFITPRASIYQNTLLAERANARQVARRLVERGMRFARLYHDGRDQHGNLPRDPALVRDIKHRRMLDDPLVGWGGAIPFSPP